MKTAPNLPPHSAPSLFLGDLFRSELATAEDLSRTQTTRLKLIVAATDIIQNQGYAELTVARVAKAAGFAHGTFYLHWADRTAVALDVIRALMEAIRKHRPPPVPGITFFDRLVDQHRFYISMYRQNAGLMQCQWQLADQDPTFGRVAIEANLALARRSLKAAQREGAAASQSEKDTLATILSCIAMVDKLLHDVCWRKLDPGLDDDGLAHNLSTTWYRAIFARDPVPPVTPSRSASRLQ